MVAGAGHKVRVRALGPEGPKGPKGPSSPLGWMLVIYVRIEALVVFGGVVGSL